MLRTLRNVGATVKPEDVACDELTVQEKKQMCDEAMRRAAEVTDPHQRYVCIGSFVEGAESTIPVPQLADPSDPYTCKPLPIEILGIEKRMFWCPNRVFTVEGSTATKQAAGFFMAGSKKRVDTIFIFNTWRTESGTVFPWAMMTSVSVLKDAALRCGMYHLVDSTTSTVAPTPE